MGSPSPIALYISMARVASSPREVRQIEALLDAGWTVYVVGFSGKDPVDPRWRFVDLGTYGSKMTLWGAAVRAWRCWRERVSVVAELFYWRKWGVCVTQVLNQLPCDHVDVIVCRNFSSAPFAWWASRRFDAPFVIDEHEHAPTQYAHFRGKMRIYDYLMRMVVARLQRTYFPRAARIMTISSPIARDLSMRYGCPVHTVRSLPPYQMPKSRELSSSDSIELLYHGAIIPNRSLEQTIRAMSLCREGRHLIIRGVGEKAYIDSLSELAHACGAHDRVTFAPCVAMKDLVASAAASDVGLWTTTCDSFHLRNTLPNKFFEYIMAGLALCVSDFPPLREIMQRCDLGVLIPNTYCPQTLADAFSALTFQDVNRFKRNAQKAAHDLSWDKEKAIFLDLCSQARAEHLAKTEARGR